MKCTTAQGIEDNLKTMIGIVEQDITFLQDGFSSAVSIYQKKFNAPNTPVETLKNCNWNIVEYQTLLEDAQSLKLMYKECLKEAKQTKKCMSMIKDWHDKWVAYLRNLFKKKRIAADHIIVFMISDEQRKKKPYALPIKFIPCRTLKDQVVRNLNKEVKEKMKERNLAVVGTTTDGEFSSLRTKGETRPLHLWQIIHDSRKKAKRINLKTLQEMIIVKEVKPDGTLTVEKPHPAITVGLLNQLHTLLQIPMALEDAVSIVRKRLVPEGYIPYPFGETLQKI